MPSAMSSIPKVAVLVGSLRKESLTRKFMNAAVALNAAPLSFEFVETGNLPLYNQDLEGENAPPEWIAMRQQLKSTDAVLFATPEYNRSMPGCLKNALDVASRPYGSSAWEAKPGAVISISPGNLGAFGANHHIRQCLVFLNVPTMQQPEAYIGNATNLFDAEGKFVNESTREFMKKFLLAFAAWIEATRKR
jgi:chromate reductase